MTNLRPEVQRDFDWQRCFIPELKRIVGEHLIGEAPAEEDAERNTDLIVLRLEAVRVACRIRHWQYIHDYGDEFTIRASRPSGAKTEMRKLVEGFGDYILYAFADEKEEHLAAWLLGDLSLFRGWFAEQLMRIGKAPGTRRHNGDGTSFYAFNILDLPADFVVARKFAQVGMAAA